MYYTKTFDVGQIMHTTLRIFMKLLLTLLHVISFSKYLSTNKGSNLNSIPRKLEFSFKSLPFSWWVDSQVFNLFPLYSDCE